MTQILGSDAGYPRAQRGRIRIVASGGKALLRASRSIPSRRDTVVDTLLSMVERDVLDATYLDVQTVVAGFEQTLPG
ncbi:hypothetical protein [Halobellus ordinarius]|uniref:hypothetical protein n=1 Tax=Halobellus ordinarius TaxID=3075120 RepID=UPI0028806A0D|nr:hypothetical protein [Halobellus sp. ZY16]